MSRLENRVAGLVVNIRSRGNANAADLCRQRVGDVITIQVQGRQNAVLLRTGQNLLQHGIGNDILDHDLRPRIGVLEGVPRTAVELLRTVLLPGDLVAPCSEGALGELHDISLVNEGDARQIAVDRVIDGCLYQSSRAFLRYRLNANAGGIRETDLLVGLREVLLHEG